MNRYTHFSRKANRSAERGIALLYTLGILSVILVVTLIFVTMSRSSAKIAAAYNSSQSAQMLARSTLARIAAALEESSDRFVISHDAKGGSVQKDADQTCDWIWRLETAGLVNFEDKYDKKAYPTWQYVRIKDPVNNQDRIIGRYAYLTLADTKINPSGLVYHGYCTENEFKDNVDISDNLNKGDCFCKDSRLGLSSSEFFYQFVGADSDPKMPISDYPDYKDIEFIGTPLIWESYLQDNIDGKTNWATPENFLTSFSDAANPSIPAKLQEYFDQLVRVNQYYETTALVKNEVFWAGYDNPAREKKLNQYYHRFNLRRDDWGDLTVDDLIAIPKTLESASKIDDDKTGGIMWLNKWSGTGSGDADATKRQIAANIINYNSPETRAVVSDIAPGTWDALAGNTHPKYTGLKRTPYLNEFVAQVIITPNVVARDFTVGEEVKTEYTVSIDAQIKVYSELINIYAKPITGSYKPVLDGSVKVDVKFTKPDGTEHTQGFTPTEYPLKNIGFASWDFPDSYTPGTQKYTDGSLGNYVIDHEFTPYSEVFIDTPGKEDAIKNSFIANVDLKLDRAYLKKSTDENVDYSAFNIQETQFGTDSTDIKIECVAQGNHFVVSVQTDDPRQNLYPEDWFKQIKFTTDSTSLFNEGKPEDGVMTVSSTKPRNQKALGTLVSASGIGENGDYELVGDPAWDGVANDKHISTAFIRHDAMKSLWEMGAIHRGAKWQTLNLTTSPEISIENGNNMLNIGGGTYLAGDGAILDQLKMMKNSSYRTDYLTKINVAKTVNLPLQRFNYSALLFNFPFAKRTAIENTGDVISSYDIDKKWFIESAASDYPVLRFVDYRGDAAVKYIPFVEKLMDSSNYASGKNISTSVDDDDLSTTNLIHRRTDLYHKEQFRKAFTVGNETDMINLTALPDALREQMPGRLMNLLEVEEDPELVKVIILAQTINDVGGTGSNEIVVLKDWNNDGATGTKPTFDSSPEGKTGLYNAGYLRYDDSIFMPNDKMNSLVAPFGYIINAKQGVYDNGADQITGESKISAQLLYDPITRKWRTVRFDYVD